jgi:Cu+-exporting ATPase
MTAFVLPGMDAASVSAAPPSTTTVVSVKKLCPTCGKKIAQKLEQLPQTHSTSINVEQRTVTVVAKQGQSLSPRIVWEIVEKGGEQPVRLQSPSGTFTAKPQQ